MIAPICQSHIVQVTVLSVVHTRLFEHAAAHSEHSLKLSSIAHIFYHQSYSFRWTICGHLFTHSLIHNHWYVFRWIHIIFNIHIILYSYPACIRITTKHFQPSAYTNFTMHLLFLCHMVIIISKWKKKITDTK